MKVHEVTVYQCSVCKHQFQSAIELKTHKDEKHPVASVHCKDKCKKYDELLPNYNQLKENYERLIQINKKLQTNSKDKEYALEIQLEELRVGYEKEKREKMKLQDNLETQNKLWKMWIQKF